MFNFSSKTEVNKKFKIMDLNKQIGITKEARKEQTKIESVVLKNVIAPNTLNCDIDKETKEIYVFEITMKEQYIPECFIKELDKSIRIPTLFVVKYDGLESAYISYKNSAFKSKYYSTNWSKDMKIDLPLSVNVPKAYKFILSKFLTYLPFENETIEEYVRRNNQLIKLDYQIKKTESAIQYETQSKKKFEYNARLKEYQQSREELLKENV